MGIKSTAKKYYKKFKKAFTRNNNNETVTRGFVVNSVRHIPSGPPSNNQRVSDISRRGAVKGQMRIIDDSSNNAVGNGIDGNNTLSEQNSSGSNLNNIEVTNERRPSEQGILDLFHVAQTYRNILGPFIPGEKIKFVGNTNDNDIGTFDVKSMVGEIVNVEPDAESMDSYSEPNGSIDSHNNHADPIIRNNSLKNGQYNDSVGRSNSAPIQNLTKKNSTRSLKSNRSQNSIY